MEDVGDRYLFDQINKIVAFSKEWFSINNFLRTAYLKLYPKYCQRKKLPVKCQALSSTFFIDPYGDMFPCVVFNNKLMNIKEMTMDLITLWRSERAQRISKQCIQNLCPVCWSPCDAFSAISGSLLKAMR